jgi:hypothetical protein
MIDILLFSLLVLQTGDQGPAPSHVKGYLDRCMAAGKDNLPLPLPPQKDDVGVFQPANEKDARQGRSVDVLEIVGDDDAIVRAWYAPTPPVSGKPTLADADPTFVDLWIHGVETSGFTAGEPVKLPQVFHVSGNRLFDTTCGKRSLPLLEPIDVDRYRKKTADAGAPHAPINIPDGPKIRPVALPDGSFISFRSGPN